MKNSLLLLLMIITVSYLSAQTLSIPDTIGTSSVSGKVGIGISNPSAKLDIRQSGTMGGKYDQNAAHVRIGDGSTNLLMDGNEIYSNNELIIGTSYSHSISFRNVNSSGNQRLMDLTSSGNLGIGTGSPSSKLSIRNLGGNDGVKLLDFSEANDEEFIFKGNFSGTGASGNTLFLGSGVTGFKSEIMSWRGDGNVGIGTSNPVSILDINGGASADAVLRLEADTDNLGSEADNPRIEMYQDNKLIYAHIGFNEDIPTPYNIFQIGMGSPNGFIRDAMTFDPYTGYVGVGILSPTERLSVNGTIRAQEVKVESTGWPDFVFGEEYRLPSLKETESFIKENKHLPGIPTEEEVMAEGISLGEMNAKLLEKIEELTLYLIDLNKQINQLTEENMIQSEQIKKYIDNSDD